MREFKKDKDETVRSAVAPLVKAFQNEVDNLSKRSKAAEKAFFNAYKCVTDISDPVPVLLSAIEAQKGLAKVGVKNASMSRSFKLKTSSVQVADMEIEIKQLRETIQDYNQEIQEYKVKEKKLNELQAKVSQKSVSRERELDHGRNALQVDAYDKNIDETLNEKIRDVSDRMLEEYNEKLVRVN